MYRNQTEIQRDVRRSPAVPAAPAANRPVFAAQVPDM